MAFEELESKDPNSSGKDYVFDFAPLTNGQSGAVSDYLQAGELISTIVSVATNDPLLNIDSSSITDTSTSVTVLLSGGTVNTYADVTVRITTDLARTDDRTFRILIEEK